MKLENIFYAGLLFAVCAFGITYFYGGLARDYGITPKVSEGRYEYADVAARVSNTTETASGGTTSGLKKAVLEIPGVTTVFSTLQFASTAISALFSTYDITNALFTTIFSSPYLGLPTQMKSYLYMSLGVGVLFALLAAVIKWRA